MGASTVVVEGLVDPASLEARACNEALALALDLHLDSICVASDCIEVVRNIDSGAPCRYVTTLREIKDQRNMFRDVLFTHEGRQHNGEAHMLAKAASSLPTGRHVWLDSMPDIICIPMNIEC